MKAQTIEWWTFEDDPMQTYGDDAPALLEVAPDYETGFPGQEVGITPAGEDLPEDVMARLLRLVAEDFDAGACEVNGCGFVLAEQSQGIAPRPGARPNTVGYSLHGEADEETRWHMTTVVKIPDGRLVLACEECNPENMYVLMAPGEVAATKRVDGLTDDPARPLRVEVDQ